MNRPSTPWKPPIGLVLLDGVGLILLAAGLTLHFAPTTGPLTGLLPPSAALPLMVVGGGVVATAMLLLVRSILGARRG